MRLILLSLIFLATIPLSAQKKKGLPKIGVVQDIEFDSLLKSFGYTNLVESTQKMLSPKKVSEQQFQIKLQQIKSSRIPVFACNLFIPGELKVIGPVVDEKVVLEYVEIVFQRAQTAKLKMIIWGSGGSRQVPNGFDFAKATEQFVYMAKKIAVLAKKYHLTIALESLNSTEGNFIKTVKEALEVVKKVNHKNLRLCADMYHMLKEGEGPDIIEQAKGYLVYCEIAEKNGRTPPGVQGDDFRPYLRALKKIDYHGLIVIECRWENLKTQGADAYRSLSRQIAESYNK